MILQSLLDNLNAICAGYIKVLADLKKVKTFQTLVGGNEKLRAEESELRRAAASPRMRQPFSPVFACAIIGSTGHGKTSILLTSNSRSA